MRRQAAALGGVEVQRDPFASRRACRRRAEALVVVALAMSEVYRSDPDFAAPAEVWERLREACPDLLR